METRDALDRSTNAGVKLSRPEKLWQHRVQAVNVVLIDKLRGTWIHSAFKVVRDLRKRMFRRSDGEAILLERYVRMHGEDLDLANPQTFTQKLFHRMVMLNRRPNRLITQLSDKYAARDYVRTKIGEQHLVKLLWDGNDPKEIPFDKLPREYVIKTNHGSKQVIVVNGTADRNEIIVTLSAWLKSNYYWAAREYQYYDIKPRIMVEEYLRSGDANGPLDYRFYCFQGIPEVIQVDNHAHDINPFFDTKWNQIDLYYREEAARPAITKPINLELMNAIASQLSGNFSFVRVDLYNIDGRIYFGEFTFTPTSGQLKLQPRSWDIALGKKWDMSADF